MDYARRHPTVVAGAAVLFVMALIAIFAPLIANDPMKLTPINRLKPPGEQYWFGTDFLGREVFARTIYGARVSLIVGGAVALVSVAIGLVIGLVAGYVRWIDAIVMRIMDGIMAIPGVLLAIALIAVAGASLMNVIIAITIPEIPRVVRLVRSVVLSIREQPYVEAAVSVGSPLPKILFKHILPNTIAPLIVQATFVCASAVVIEAILSFLGAGTPPEIPSWGNIMAEGRTYFQVAPWILFFPGLLLAITVLAVNILGDGLRDSLDPRIARRM
ncbi:MAG: ABC transporter permease [Betaproteobacteria bacterium]|nr:MAG: ABC transporter permease [Betaproteobacteria bacterium]